MGKLNLGDHQKGTKKEKQLVVNRVIWIEKLKQEVTQSQVFCPFFCLFVCLFLSFSLFAYVLSLYLCLPSASFFPLDVKLFFYK